MKNRFSLFTSKYYLSLLFLLLSVSVMAQEVYLLDTPTVGYDTTVTIVMKVKTNYRLNKVSKIIVNGTTINSDLTISDITPINDTLLSFRMYTGTTETAGFKQFIVSFPAIGYYSMNGFWLSGTRMTKSGAPIRRGSVLTHQLSVFPHNTTTLSSDAIIAAFVVDSLNNPVSFFTLDSVKIINSNTISVNITTATLLTYGHYKLKLILALNGPITYNFEIKAPNLSSVSHIRGSAFSKSIVDSSYSTLFKKGAPNTVTVFKNNQPVNDIRIDSVKSTFENTLVIYGFVPPTTSFGNYSLQIINSYDTLSTPFKVLQPVIATMARTISRNKTNIITVTTTNATLNSGITTLSLVNPSDSLYIQLSDLQIPGANSFSFKYQTTPVAKAGYPYYIKLYNSFDTITIIDSLFIPTGTITYKSNQSVRSESQNTVELLGNGTLFTKEKPTITITAAINGLVKVDSVYVKDDLNLKVWFTTDALAEGNLLIKVNSTIDGAIQIGQFLNITRPIASIKSIVRLGYDYYDSAQVYIAGNRTHFTRTNKLQLFMRNTYNEHVYDDNLLRIEQQTILSDSTMSFWVYTIPDTLYPLHKEIYVSITDSVSGELKISGTYISLTEPIVIIPPRSELWRQKTDTLLLTFDCLIEQNMKDIDSVRFVNYNSWQPIPGIRVTGYTFTIKDGNPCVLLDLAMEQPLASGTMLLQLFWRGQIIYLKQIELRRPQFVFAEYKASGLNDSTINMVFVFKNLFDSTTALYMERPEVQVIHSEVRGDSLFTTVHYDQIGTYTFHIGTLLDGYIYDDNLTIVNNTGLNENVNPILDIYPNPAKETIQVKMNVTNTIEYITITDIMGKVYANHTITQSNPYSLNIDFLPVGLYTLMIRTDKGNTIHYKFVKE